MLNLPMRFVVLISLILLLTSSFASAQNSAIPVSLIAYVQDTSLNVYDPITGNIQNISSVSDTSFAFYRPFWSPDGRWLAYTVPDPGLATNATLYLSDLQAEPWALLTTDFAAPFHPIWLNDGRIMYASYSGERHEMTAILNAYAILPEAGAEPELLGSFEVSEGCGGGASNPAESAYFLETSLGGYREVFNLTPYGLVHDGQCVGARITLTNLQSNEVTTLADGHLVKGLVSTDGEQVMGISDTQLMIVHLTDMSSETVATSTIPEQFIWQDESHIIYSSRTPNGDLLEPFNETEIEAIRAALSGFLPDIMPRFQSDIFLVDLSTGEETRLYTADAFAIGRMAVRDNWLVFSLVENADRWVNAMADGTISAENNFSLWADMVNTQIYALNLSSGEIKLLLENGQQMTVAP